MFQQPSEGDRFKAADHNGSLLLIWAKEYRQDVQTDNGPTDAIAGDIHVLDGQHGGEKFENSLVFPSALVGSLRNAVGGEPVLGRLGQGVSKPGKSPPWMLSPFTDADAALATGYIQRMAKPFQAPADGTAPTAPAPAAAPAKAELDLSTLDPAVVELLKKTGAIPA